MTQRKKSIPLFDELRQLTRKDIKRSGMTKTQYAEEVLDTTQPRFSHFIRENNPGRLNEEGTDKLVARLRKVGLMQPKLAAAIKRAVKKRPAKKRTGKGKR